MLRLRGVTSWTSMDVSRGDGHSAQRVSRSRHHQGRRYHPHKRDMSNLKPEGAGSEDGGRRVKLGSLPFCYRSTTPLVLIATAVLWFALCVDGVEAEYVNCCSGPDAVVDCSSGVEYQGQHYFCMGVETSEMRACVSCISPVSSGAECSSCCGTTNTECDLEWSWGAVLATLSVSAVFATCSGILALAEKRRKHKGISLARAWSLPHGMPMLRATVVDLSDAVRGRSSRWGSTASNDICEADELEHVGLLEGLPNDSIYGALVEQGDEDIPVAKVAEDNWVTAMAWHRAHPPVSFEHVDDNADRSVSAPTSMSRWRSARATARQARRAAMAAAAAVAPNRRSAGLSPSRSGASGGPGSRSGWASDPEGESGGGDSCRGNGDGSDNISGSFRNVREPIVIVGELPPASPPSRAS